LDPDSAESLDPYPNPDWEFGSGSGSRQAKQSPRKEKNEEISSLSFLINIVDLTECTVQAVVKVVI
jgi:hypothetical protein